MPKQRLSFEEISAIMLSRRMSDSTLLAHMQDIAARYDGNVIIPLPDVAGEPTMPLTIPNLIADAIDQNALRASSTTPQIWTPQLSNHQTSEQRAIRRRRALYSAWDHSALLETLLPRSYRHLTGYGTNCLVVLPDFECGRARIEIRDPLTAYPEHRSPEDTREPRNVGFVFGRSREWICSHYPDTRIIFNEMKQRVQSASTAATNVFMDTLWDVVEWIDEDQIVMGVLGPRDTSGTLSRILGSGMGFHLKTWDNLAGMVPVAIPRRVTLNQIDGQVSKLTGLVDMMGKLMALDVLAADKAVFPDFVVIDDTGTPQLLNASGKWNDGRTGEANLLKAKSVQLLNASPGPLTHPVIDRLERNFRMSSGQPGMLGGENSNALRTGNALDAMTGIAVDPRIQELQRIMCRALKVVNTAVVEVEKGYFGNNKQVFFSGWPGDKGHVEYVPNEDFDSSENVVQYAFPGTDINQLTVAIGQAVGAGLISKKTARAKHPLNESPEEDERQIVAETLLDAGLGGLVQQAASGAIPIIDLMVIIDEYRKHGDLGKAVEAADEKARARQATPAPPTAPESMPGLSAPGMGAESIPEPSPIDGPAQGTLDFASLANALSAAPQ